MPDFKKIQEGFREFLFANDRLVGFRIDYSLSYSSKEGYYKIRIFSSKNNPNFDSRQYFMERFETKGGLEKLAEFADKNNVGLITY
ncbi:MAG TPA: hypothetical protein PK357_02760 [Candidatus Pacearchaeota archaeon]|nr:hypothetical protein [Candidatus Pacearchaeota archaeon]